MSLEQNPGCLGFLVRLFGGTATPDAAPAFPYKVRDDFLSPAELSFYHVLVAALDGRAMICPKVKLSDVFFVPRPHENQTARNLIAQKHVDFLVCNIRTLRPIFGVELDDASHARADRQARDEIVERTFAAAQLPLLRVPAQRSYSLPELSTRIAPMLNKEAMPSGQAAMSAIAPVQMAEATSPPLCPKCGVPMVLRTAGRGERSGQQFFGCPNYPKCRETVPI